MHLSPMRFNAVFLVLATSLASASPFVARGVNDLPSCSLPCITNADTGTCAPTDNACLCKYDNFLRTTTDCIESACSNQDLRAAAVVCQELCTAAGVNIMTNPAAQPRSTSLSVAPTSTGAPSSNTAPTGSIVDKSVLISGFAVAAAVLTL